LDSLLVFGSKDEKLTGFLKKMGYNLISPGDQDLIPELVEKSMVDLILIDSRIETQAVDLCEFLRAQDSTKQVPIVFVSANREELAEIKSLGLPKLEFVAAPYSIGSVVSKIATQVRLRKMAGEDEGNASIGEVNARLRDLNQRFTKQLQEAQAIQLSLIPKVLPQDHRFDLAVAYQPLEQVGGDWYYAAFSPSNKLSVQIADVTGHGLSAAFICAMTKLALIAAERELPHELLRQMNMLMSTSLHSGTFVTAFSYLYDPASGHLDFARAGHPPGLLLDRAKGEVSQLKSDGFAFGFFAMSEYSHGQATLGINDVLMIYTDGLSEAQDRNGVSYGYQRPSDLLRDLDPGLSSAEMLSVLLEDFDSFRDGRLLKDDTTAIMLKRLA